MIGDNESRRKFLSVASLSVLGGIAGCISGDLEGSGSSNEPVLGEVIQEFAGDVTVGTYEQPYEDNSLEDWQYRGRGSIPLLITHLAQIQYTLDLSVQEGYDTVPLNCYFLDADNFLNLRHGGEVDIIDGGSAEQIDDVKTFKFYVKPGLYYLVLSSSEVGRESELNVNFEAREMLNYGSECTIELINVPHLSLVQTEPFLNREYWNVRFHVQYNGEAGQVYNLELSLISSDDETTIDVQQEQVEDCETNFVYDGERKGLNVVNSSEKLMARIKILNEEGDETLVDLTREIQDVVW
jgi:hypothetical protein